MLSTPPPLSHRRRPPLPVPPPPPPPPPAPALVVSTAIGAGGFSVTFVFDQPLVLVGPPPYAMDGSVVIGEATAVGVTRVAPAALTFDLEGTPVGPGNAWAILAQPAWLATSVEVPQSGDF